MCDICDDHKTGRLKIGPALKKIGQRLNEVKNEEEKVHLWIASDRILQEDASMSETNAEMDAIWWNATHKKDPEDI